MSEDSVATSDKNVMFSLSGTSTGFEARSASVFAALDEPIDKTKSPTRQVDADSCLMPPPHSRSDSRRHERRCQSRGKKPPADHVLHPERWKKYSLEDTELSSDGQNKQAAFAFLAELRKRKSPGTQRADVTDCPPKFKKPKREETANSDVVSETRSAGSSQSESSGKVVLKEYAVGVRRPKARRGVQAARSGRERLGKVQALTLSHLEDEGEDGDEEEGEDVMRGTACDGDSRDSDTDVVTSDRKT